MPKFIKLTDHASNGTVEFWMNADNIFSIHRQPGTDATVIKAIAGYEKVRETPEQILAAIAALDVPMQVRQEQMRHAQHGEE